MILIEAEEALQVELTTEGMARALGLHPRGLQRLQQEGWIEGKVGYDRWNMTRTAQSYMAHLQLCKKTAARSVI